MSTHGSDPDLHDKVDSPQHSKLEIDQDKDDNNNNNNNNGEYQTPSVDPPELSIPQLLEEVDSYMQKLSSEEQINSNPPEVPNCVELLSNKMDSLITDYQEDNSETKFGNNPDDDSSFVESLKRLSKLSDQFAELSSNPELVSALNRTSSVLQRAMSFFDEEFRCLLEDTPNQRDEPDKKTQMTLRQSFSKNNVNNQATDQCTKEEEILEFPSFSPETISKMNKIASAMISSGYETECCMLYSISRRNAFKGTIEKLSHENISIDDVQKMQWESVEGEIINWIAVVKQCSTVLFSGEHKLCDAVFSNHLTISQSLFSNLARAVAIQLLNFAEAVVLTKRLPEKLFKILDMYETLRELIQSIDGSYPAEIAKDLISEVGATKCRLGEAAVSIFCTLENSIRSDQGRTPVPSGAVHPLTRYVVNYLKYACEYKDTLEQVFQQHLNDAKNKEEEENRAVTETEKYKNEGTHRASPLSTELMSVMELLDTNLDMKSKLYRDTSLSFVFLMNNGRYILQKIKGSPEIHQLVGDNWCRKRSSQLRGYHKNYQRETWGKVLQCLNHEGLQVNGKVSKVVLKERFKSFNAMFEEIHKTQSTWVVSDEQLQSELRVSVSAVMIPAYRSFFGRFKQHLDSGRQTEKYIKYQPEDIENLIDDLFDGNPMSMQRRRL